VLFNLTKRQLICFSLGALAGVPIFFLLKPVIGLSVAALVMIVVMLPFFLLAMYEKNGMPFEQYVGNIIELRFRRPSQRPYQTNNFYAVLQRQAALEKEVHSIVQKKQRRKTNPRRQKGHRQRNHKSARRG
jgi:hypothetical protein